MADNLEQLGERNYPATPLQLERARQRGQIARSNELSSAVAMLGALGLAVLCGPAIVNSLTAMVGDMLGGAGSPQTGLSGVSGLVSQSLLSLAWPVAGVAAGTVLLAVGAGLVQAGLLAAPQQVAPDWQRLAPAAGLRRLLSLRTLERAAMLLVRLAAVGAIAFWTIRSAMPRIATCGHLGAAGMMTEAGGLVGRLVVRAGAVLVVLGILDYLYQRWQHRRDLRMTHRQFLDDLRQMEGLANVRGKQRGAEQRTARNGADRQAASTVQAVADASQTAVTAPLRSGNHSARSADHGAHVTESGDSND